MLMMTAAGSLEKLDCSSDVLTNLASIDLQLVTTDHLYAAQTVVSQCLSDKWWDTTERSASALPLGDRIAVRPCVCPTVHPWKHFAQKRRRYQELAHLES